MYKIQVRQSRVYSLEIQLSINVSSFDAKIERNEEHYITFFFFTTQQSTHYCNNVSSFDAKIERNEEYYIIFLLLYYTVINQPITANHYLYFGETRESKTQQSFLHPFKLNTECSEFVLKKTKRHEGGRSLLETTVSTVKSGDMSHIAHCSLLQ